MLTMRTIRCGKRTVVADAGSACGDDAASIGPVGGRSSGVLPVVERLLAELPLVPEVPVCRHGHGPLDGWRARGPHRGRYCRACNAAAYRRWYDAHRRGH